MMLCYYVYCDVHRNGELILEHDLVTYDPYYSKAKDMVEEDVLAYAEGLLMWRFGYREAEECLTEVNIEGMDVGGDFIQFQFREPTYNVQITEIYDNFVIEERATEIPRHLSTFYSEEEVRNEEIIDELPPSED